MPALPTEALRAARFMLRHMYRPVATADGGELFAVSENPSTQDLWFWCDDNSKTLEFLSRPEVWREFREETGQILRFVASMCRGPFIFRRLAGPQMTPAGQDGGATRLAHSLMWITHDLRAGKVGAALRFHDDRNALHLLLAGHRIEFTYRGRHFSQPIALEIGEAEAAQEGPALVLRHAGEHFFTPYLRRVRLGRSSFVYRFDQRSMLIEVEAAFDVDPGAAIADVTLAIGHQGLAAIDYTSVYTDLSPAPLFAAGNDEPGRRALNGAGYYMIRHRHVSGDAPAIHTLPREPGRLAALEIAAGASLDEVHAHYSFPGPQQGRRLVVTEYKLLTGGGFYERVSDYIEMIRAERDRSPRSAACDYSISYDYGVTINAFAKCFAAAAAEPHLLLPSASSQHLRQLCDEYLGHYFTYYVDRDGQQPNAIFSRELSFVILAALTMFRATGNEQYRERAARMCDILLDFELPFGDDGGFPASGFLMRRNSPRAAYVDCQSAALLALTQAAPVAANARILTAIDRGIAAYVLDTNRGFGGIVDTVGAIMIDEQGVAATENAFWNFKVGMTLRFVAALAASPDPGIQALAARHRKRLALLRDVMRRQLERSAIDRGDQFEITCCPLHETHAETNSETQPWVMLGLLGHPCD